MTLFWITLMLFFVFIAIGNYLMLKRVLPTVNETIEMMPTEQAKQIDRYLERLETNQKRGLGHLFLRIIS